MILFRFWHWINLSILAISFLLRLNLKFTGLNSCRLGNMTWTCLWYYFKAVKYRGFYSHPPAGHKTQIILAQEPYSWSFEHIKIMDFFISQIKNCILLEMNLSLSLAFSYFINAFQTTAMLEDSFLDQTGHPSVPRICGMSRTENAALCQACRH
jgi:hypothetical protein